MQAKRPYKSPFCMTGVLASGKPEPALRIFLSAPGDVGDERGLSRKALVSGWAKQHLLRDRSRLHGVSRDEPASAAGRNDVALLGLWLACKARLQP